jgi:hypothetical protein
MIEVMSIRDTDFAVWIGCGIYREEADDELAVKLPINAEIHRSFNKALKQNTTLEKLCFDRSDLGCHDKYGAGDLDIKLKDIVAGTDFRLDGQTLVRKDCVNN